MNAQEMAEACANAMWDLDTASQNLGMRIEHIAPGQATLSMEITKLMSNGHGNCHGGYIFTLADSAFAFACNGYNQLTVAQNCSITYISPGRIGDRLTAEAREISRKGPVRDLRYSHFKSERRPCRRVSRPVADGEGHSSARSRL